MAIMQKCCCFPNVRSGSIACGIYSMIYSCIWMAYTVICYIIVKNVIGIVFRSPSFLEYDESFNLPSYYAPASIAPVVAISLSPFTALFGVGLFAEILLFVSSIILIVGVNINQRGMLIPYMVAVILHRLITAISVIVSLAVFGLAAAFISLIIGLAGCALFAVMEIICLLCVISQYQNLRDGRGQAYANFGGELVPEANARKPNSEAEK